MIPPSQVDFVRGAPRALLRLEGLVLLAVATTVYVLQGGGWQMFALLALAPDLAFVGYAFGRRVGAIAYNTTHTTVLPLSLLAAGLLLEHHTLLLVALIWLAHIGFDRALGYGLKYASAFGHTHLGPIGRDARST